MKTDLEVHSVHLDGVTSALKERSPRSMSALSALNDGGMRLPQVHSVNTSKILPGDYTAPSRRVHRCGVVDEHGRPCPTWTLQARCLKHRRQRAAERDE